MSACETQLVSACGLDIGHRKSYDRTKMSYQKDTEDKDDRSFRTSNKAKTERNTGNRQEGI